MKTIFLFSILIFSLQLNAQKSGRYTLSGIVTDAAGIPLSGASVYIPDIRKGAIADQNGDYQITNIPDIRKGAIADQNGDYQLEY